VSDDLVQLTVVGNELEAEMVRSLLATAGIESMQRYTDFGAGSLDGMPSGAGPRAILVHANDLEAARELIASE
jgi:putative signal transducing protein